MRLTALRFIMCFLGVAGLAQCGDEAALSSKVRIQFLPENAIAVNTPTQNGEDEIAAPWFLFFSEATNNSDRTLTLANYKMQIYGFNSGTITEAEVSLALDSGDCDERAFLAILTPGQSYRQVDTCDPAVPLTADYEEWFISGLPASSSNSYSVEIEAEGWFEDAGGIPIERLTYTGFMTIQ